MSYPNPLVLIVLDGWGVAPPSETNAIYLAKKPFWDKLMKTYLQTLLHADGEWVGLPHGEVGSSETGHLTIGAGRAVYQDYSRINTAISEGKFFRNKVLVEAFSRTKERNKSVHLMGLGGMGGVHSSRFHLYSLVELGRRLGIAKDRLKIHIFSDGRDTDPRSGIEFGRELEEVLKQKGVGQVASLMGRYWAMDRDRRWQRTAKAYQALTAGSARHASTLEDAFQNSYQEGVTDEFIQPVSIGTEKEETLIGNGDTVIHFNFRTDRARQLTKAFVLPEFSKFPRKIFLDKLHFVSLVEFEKDLPVTGVAFKPLSISNTLGETLAKAGIRQARVAETEKYAFVTYYFNGLCEDCIGTEEKFLIPSPKVPTYDLQPEMSAEEIARKVVSLIRAGRHPFILVNFANPDMVAHTGKTEATIKAIETVDRCLAEITPLVLEKGGVCLITADHGNAENTADTKHNPDPVPFLAVGNGLAGRQATKKMGSLADVAPTVLSLFRLPQPQEMTGQSLIPQN